MYNIFNTFFISDTVHFNSIAVFFCKMKGIILPYQNPIADLLFMIWESRKYQHSIKSGEAKNVICCMAANSVFIFFKKTPK